ncbi:hypothetical protein [Lysinibacillus xylanilyticus]|uniref:hypothetical protein n=1 Tax=Lysinibacillus xylanilyticus TaxID=582475 RepID=UPI003D03CAEE
MGGTKAYCITSCDNAFMTNILLLLSLRFTTLSRKTHLLLSLRFTTLSRKTHLLSRRQQEALLCATAAMFYLCESEATATMF